MAKIVSEYDQEIPESQTADNPVASMEEPLNHHETPALYLRMSTKIMDFS